MSCIISRTLKCQHFSDLPTFPVDDVYGGGAAEGMADASEFPVDDEDIPDTGKCTKIFHRIQGDL